MQVVKEDLRQVAVMEGGSVVEEGGFEIFSNPHGENHGGFCKQRFPIFQNLYAWKKS